jgi:hypothetical protein
MNLCNSSANKKSSIISTSELAEVHPGDQKQKERYYEIARGSLISRYCIDIAVQLIIN